MKQDLLNFYRGSRAGKLLLSFPRHLYKSLANRYLSDEAWCRDRFSWDQGYSLNLRNSKTLNEKLQYLKLFNRDPELAFWADKYGVRERVREILGERFLIPLLAISEDPARIQFEELVEPFIVKPTHSSGKTIIVRDRREANWTDVRRACHGWLKSNFYPVAREWHYKDIPPRIIVEKLLQDSAGELPSDFKCHCFHGRVVFVQVDIDRHTNHKRNFYDRNWSRMPFTWSVCVGSAPMWPPGREIDRPEKLIQMIDASEALAKRFPYVRMDWYLLEENLFFGEATFNHGGGFERILPIEWDCKLGDLLQLDSTHAQPVG